MAKSDAELMKEADKAVLEERLEVKLLPNGLPMDPATHVLITREMAQRMLALLGGSA
jgi:hypothetical protein